MRSPAAAFAWEFRHRHRWGLIALAGYLLVMAAIKLLPGPHITVDSPEGFGFVVMVPLAATFTYLLAMFSFGLTGDLGARQSTFPPRLFSLPVTTAALAGWPMLYGTAAMATLWLATRLVALWPAGMEVPVLWPAVAAAVLVAWTQALTWMPYGLPGLRVIVGVLCLGTMDSVVLLALRYQASETTMVAILAPQLPLAYLVARLAVARARRGDVPDWRWLGSRPRVERMSETARLQFASPAVAQAWFEWRRYGWSLPAWVAILLPLELALLFVTGDTPELVFLVLLGVLMTPAVMAVFVAATVRQANPFGRDAYGLSPFEATRPWPSAALVAAKFKAMLWSTLATWLLVGVAIPLGLKLSGTAPVVIDRAGRLVGAVGMPRAIVLSLLLVSSLIALTWKQLVQGLYIGLSGRAWLVKGSVFVILSSLFLLGWIIEWLVEHPGARQLLWGAFPGILALLACVKTGAAMRIGGRLYRRRLLSDRALLTAAAAWCIAVLALYGVFVWFFSTPFVRRDVLACIAILAVPLVRLSAAPLALAWNRHR